MTTAVGRSSLWLSLSFPIFLLIHPLVISPLAAQEFFEDFEPEDINITSGGTLNILSGGTLHVQSGATLTIDTTLTVNVASSTAFRVQNGSGTNVFAVDTPATTVKVTTTTDNANGFSVADAAANTVFAVNTVTDSVSIRQDLTLGTGGAPIIDIGSGSTLFIFPPGNTPHQKTIEVQGDISLSGDIWNPAFFEVQSNLASVENTLNDKMTLLSSLEKKVDRVSKEVQSVNKEMQSVNKEVQNVNREVESVREVTDLSPGFIELSKVTKEKNLRKKDLEPLISGHQSVADRLHTHERYSNDVTFEKDARVKGERIYIRSLPDRSEIVSFAHESMKALVSEAGVGWLVNGEALIKLDPRFLELVTISPSTPFFVQLTPGGDCKGLFVSRTSDTGFSVRESDGGTAAIPFYWKVDAFRRGLEGVSYVDPETYDRLK